MAEEAQGIQRAKYPARYLFGVNVPVESAREVYAEAVGFGYVGERSAVNDDA